MANHVSGFSFEMLFLSVICSLKKKKYEAFKKTKQKTPHLWLNHEQKGQRFQLVQTVAMRALDSVFSDSSDLGQDCRRALLSTQAARLPLCCMQECFCYFPFLPLLNDTSNIFLLHKHFSCLLSNSVQRLSFPSQILIKFLF